MEIMLGFLAALIPLTFLVLLLVYVTKTNALTYRIKVLESEVQILMRKITRQEETVKPPPVIPASPVKNEVAHSQQADSPGISPIRPEISEPARVEPLFEPSMTSFPARPPSRTREEWESLIGGKLLNRIGALALIIGIGFFLKYAFDNNWLTETMRVVIGCVIGVGLLVGAARTHAKGFEVFSQGLVGAGLATLYLSVYASFNFYHLVPQTIAFVLMSGVTILAFLQGFRYDSLAVSLIGALGGFLTPFLLSTGEANQVGLFTYIALLDAGILAVVIMKDRWVVLEPIAFVCTTLIYIAWSDAYYTEDALLRTIYFLSIFWALFFLVDLYRGVKAIDSYPPIRSILATANTLLFYVGIYSIVEPQHHDAMGAATLAIGVIYFATGLLVQQKNSGAPLAFFRQVVTAIIMMVMATAIEFTGFRTVQWWAGEALVLVYCGVRWERKFVWAGGAVLFAVALTKLVAIPDTFSNLPVVEGSILLNQRAVTLLILLAAIAAGSFTLRRAFEESKQKIADVFDYAWPALAFLLVTVETSGFFESLARGEAGTAVTLLYFKRTMTLTIVWMSLSLALVQGGISVLRTPLAHIGLGVAGIAFCFGAVRGMTYEPLAEYSFLLNFRFLALALLLGGFVLHLTLLRGSSLLGGGTPAGVNALGILLVVLLFVLITGETRDIFEKDITRLAAVTTEGPSVYTQISSLQNQKQLSLSGIWLLYSIALMGVGLWRRRRGIRIASIVLFGFTILKIFIYDLSSLETLYRIFSFIGLGVILLVVSWLYQRYKHLLLAEGESQGGKAV